MKTHLVIHHSLTKDSETVSWNAIRKYHLSRGWRDIGYHMGVERIGKKRYEVLLGRPLLSRAAAAYQQNQNRVGVHCLFVGDFDKAPPPVEQLECGIAHLRDWIEVLGIEVTPDTVIGHRSVAPYKTCPGAKFDMNDFRMRLRG